MPSLVERRAGRPGNGPGPASLTRHHRQWFGASPPDAAHCGLL